MFGSVSGTCACGFSNADPRLYDGQAPQGAVQRESPTNRTQPLICPVCGMETDTTGPYVQLNTTSGAPQRIYTCSTDCAHELAVSPLSYKDTRCGIGGLFRCFCFCIQVSGQRAVGWWLCGGGIRLIFVDSVVGGLLLAPLAFLRAVGAVGFPDPCLLPTAELFHFAEFTPSGLMPVCPTLERVI